MRTKIFTIMFVLLCSLAQQPLKAQQHNPFLMFGTIGAAAAPVDWKPLITIAERKRDQQGNLLPLQSYDETIRRGMAFLMQDHLKWFKGPASTLLDEKGRTQMPWVYYSNLQHNGAPFPNSIDRFVSYPAFHHSLLIRTFIRYWQYSGDKQALKQAVKLGDWNIAHSTPGEWAYGNLPYSTFQEKKPGGFRDKTGLMPDKAAIMALAYIELYKASPQARFLKAAEAIGRTIAKKQRPNGTWPFRVDPKTERVIEEYTSSVIYAVMLFESLDKINGNHRYRANRDLAWKWLLNGPIKNKDFRGFYEDIPDRKSNRTNYDCLDTIRYLLTNRTDTNGYLETARELNACIEKVFLDKIKGFEPAEGIREQLQCNVVMGIHSLNWASMLLELSKATGNEKMRQRAIQTANYITYYLQPDNRIVVGFRYKQWWYSCHTGVILYLLDFVDNRGQFAQEEYLMPIRPGKPNVAPFWNQSAHQFMYAPSFNFPESKGASSYCFTVQGRDGQNHSFDAKKPYATLKPIWLKIPTGPVQLKVEALNSKGQVLKVSGKRNFHRAAMYNGPYHKQLMSYQQSAQLGLRTLFNRDDFQEWMKPNVPAKDYRKKADHKLYWGCPYPAKIMGAIVAGSALYAKITPRPADADEILAIGRKAADYLISLHLPAGTPMDFFPPTYTKEHARGFMARNNVMMNFPSVTAEAYLDFYDVTKEKKYFEAAKKIANTYRKLQLPEGTWPQVMDNNTGKATFPTLLNPVNVIRFADRLVEQYGLDEYGEMQKKAFDYLMDNTMKTFNWQSQYEDGAPNPPYGSLSPAQACEFADYLLGHSQENPSYVAQALELLRFAEDQFVSWEQPRETSLGGFPNLSSSNWITPCVSEQHQYMMPVNFSSSHLIETFLKAYQATKNKTYLAKSKDLANTLLIVQEKHKGEYPTYLVPPTADGEFEKIQNSWINCGVYTIRAVMRLSEALMSEALKDSSQAPIINGTDWFDIEGRPIQAHDGGISRFNGVFYWYGSSYAGNPKGKYDIADGPVWNGVQVYRSTDLRTWTYEGVALPRPKNGWGKLGATGRAHVIYNDKTRQYVMWYRWFLHMPASFLMVAVADRPEGPFTPLGPREVGTANGFASDMNVFKDDDGKAYLIYCDHETEATAFAEGANGRYAVRIDSLTDDYLDSNKDGVYVFDKGVEAPGMIKYKGKYIAVASGVHGWDSSETNYVVADAPLGPYHGPKVMSENKTWDSQVTDLIYLKESDTVMALCDQWWIPDRSDINKSRYLLLPVYLDPKTGKAKMKYYEKWNPLKPFSKE